MENRNARAERGESESRRKLGSLDVIDRPRRDMDCTARTVQPFKRLHQTEIAGSKLEFLRGGPIRMLTVRSRLPRSRVPSVTQSPSRRSGTLLRYLANLQVKYLSRSFERVAGKGAKPNSGDQSITRPQRQPRRSWRDRSLHQIGRTDGARDNGMDAHVYYSSAGSSLLPRVHLASRP